MTIDLWLPGYLPRSQNNPILLKENLMTLDPKLKKQYEQYLAQSFLEKAIDEIKKFEEIEIQTSESKTPSDED